MNKISKRPKGVDVYKRKVITYESVYTCPVCHTQFAGFVSRNTTRFICECGQELIVENWIELSGDELQIARTQKEGVQREVHRGRTK